MWQVTVTGPFIDENLTTCGLSSTDVIIRAGDARFSVHKVIVSDASPVLKEKIEMEERYKLKNGPPVVCIDEDADTTLQLLSFCIPGWLDDPELKDLDAVRSVLVAVQKYGLWKIERRLTKILDTTFAEKEPVRVFAIACQLRLAGTAMLAARYTLRLPMPSLIARSIPEWDNLPASQFQVLLRYHYLCGIQASDRKLMYNSPRWPGAFPNHSAGTGWIWFVCPSEDCPRAKTTYPVRLPDGNGGYRLRQKNPTQWFEDYKQKCSQLLREQPCGSVVSRAELIDEFYERSSHCPRCESTCLAVVVDGGTGRG
ncbi:hypothetical protein K474DRAFT_1031929 [Panus rudis PR-1116 ss-1]|nr:hypothetical protein K474DRAFT_1031929 [Panus rudis PR-1116 ss-1]